VAQGEGPEFKPQYLKKKKRLLFMHQPLKKGDMHVRKEDGKTI
jgi:hypothetical protein